MKNITPKDTRYVPFTQQNSCCVPTSLSIVMYKLGIPLLPIELLGYHLGLILNKDKKNLFWNPKIGERPKAGYGTQMYDKKYEINSVFKKLKIPIKVTSYPLVNFKNKKDIILFLSKFIKDNKDIVVLLNSDVLNNTSNNNGHACVIDKIYPNKDLIRLIDPLYEQPKWREFKVDKFIKAIKNHPTGLGRFLVLEKDIK
jgi:hypothetical protein